MVRYTIILVVIAEFLYISTLLTIPYNKYAMDIAGHINYIRYIAQNYALPNPYNCIECQQQPLYYIIAATAYNLGKYAGLSEPLTAVRFLSLLFYNVFLWFAIRLIRENTRTNATYYVAVGIGSFWPLGIIKASAINNDIPLYMAEIISFYYLLSWHHRPIPRSLSLAILWSAIAILFKNSGIIAAGTTASVVLCSGYRQRVCWRLFYHPRIVSTTLLALCLISLSFSRPYYYYRIVEHKSESLLISRTQELSKTLVVSNSPHYYLNFDLNTYLTQPFFTPFDDVTGRQYLWNTLLKSSLFGEYLWKSPTIALTMSQLELAMLGYMLLSWVAYAIGRPLIGCNPLMLFVSIQLLAITVFRAFYPYACHQDYRFIYAITPIMAIFYAKAIESHHMHPRIAWLGISLGIIFTALSVCFYLQELT